MAHRPFLARSSAWQAPLSLAGLEAAEAEQPCSLVVLHCFETPRAQRDAYSAAALGIRPVSARRNHAIVVRYTSHCAPCHARSGFGEGTYIHCAEGETVSAKPAESRICSSSSPATAHNLVCIDTDE